MDDAAPVKKRRKGAGKTRAQSDEASVTPPVDGTHAVAARITEPVDPAKQTRNLALQIAFILVAAIAVYGFVKAARNDQLRALCTPTCAMQPSYAGRNRIAPNFTLPDIDGKEVTLEKLRGKTVVMNFWASWCEPCMQEMPSLARLAVALEGNNDIVFVTINTDEDVEVMRAALIDTLSGDPVADARVKKHLDEGNFPFVILRDPAMKVTKDLYGTTMYPETWLIDSKGYVRSRFDGAREWDGGSGRKTIEAVDQGPGCLADFQAGKRVGPYGYLCEPEVD